MTGVPILRGVALAALLGVAGACGPTRAQPVVHQVGMQGMGFVPATLTVAPGDTVVWTNGDIVPHTVTAGAAGGPVSGELAPGAEFRWVAGAAGAVGYQCTFHPVMSGEVVVEGG